MPAVTEIRSSTSVLGQAARIDRENMVQDRAAIEMAVLVVEDDVAVGVADKELQDTDNEMDEALPNAVVQLLPVHQWQGSSNRCTLKALMNLCSSPLLQITADNLRLSL